MEIVVTFLRRILRSLAEMDARTAVRYAEQPIRK